MNNDYKEQLVQAHLLAFRYKDSKPNIILVDKGIYKFDNTLITMKTKYPDDICKCGHDRSEHNGALGGCTHVMSWDKQADGAILCECMTFKTAPNQ